MALILVLIKSQNTNLKKATMILFIYFIICIRTLRPKELK